MTLLFLYFYQITLTNINAQNYQSPYKFWHKYSNNKEVVEFFKQKRTNPDGTLKCIEGGKFDEVIYENGTYLGCAKHKEGVLNEDTGFLDYNLVQIIKHDLGIFMDKMGFYYKGRWYKNKLSRGSITHKGKKVYEGQLFKLKPHGEGTLIDSDFKYQGNFVNGYMEGYGFKTYNDGREVAGLFKNNEYVGETYFSDWKKLCAYICGNNCNENILEEKVCSKALNNESTQRIPEIYEKIKKRANRKKYFVEKEKKYIEKIKREEIQQQKDKEIKITEIKKNRDSRGKWGIHFNMSINEFTHCRFGNGTSCVFDNGLIVKTKYFEQDVYFVDKIVKDFGEFSQSKFLELKKRLSKKYQLIFPKSSLEMDLMSTKEVFFLYINTENIKEPKYISLIVRLKQHELEVHNYFYNIEVQYLSESLGKSIEKEKLKNDKFLEDL